MTCGTDTWPSEPSSLTSVMLPAIIFCSDASNSRSWLIVSYHKFSTVSVLVYLLCKGTRKLTLRIFACFVDSYSSSSRSSFSSSQSCRPCSVRAALNARAHTFALLLLASAPHAVIRLRSVREYLCVRASCLGAQEGNDVHARRKARCARQHVHCQPAAAEAVSPVGSPHSPSASSSQHLRALHDARHKAVAPEEGREGGQRTNGFGALGGDLD